MAFPSNPSNGDTYLRYGRTYEYDSAMSMWKVKKSSIAIDDLDDVDITTVVPQSGDALQWNGTNFVPFNTAKLTSYATIAELPLVGATSGQMAYVQENGRLYIFNGAGWFSVALVNIAPTITTGPDASYVFATDGTPIILTLEAQDPEELSISWSYQVSSGVLGSTATIVQDGNVFTITPSTDSNDVGTFSITFIASDGINISTAVSSFTLNFSYWADFSAVTSITSGTLSSQQHHNEIINPRSYLYSGDGMHQYYTDYGYSVLWMRSNSVAWSINARTDGWAQVGGFYNTSSGSIAQFGSVYITDDGTKAFLIAGLTTSHIFYKFETATPWDFTSVSSRTAVQQSSSITTNRGGSYAWMPIVSEDGVYISFVSNDDQGQVFVWKMNTPWDLSTITYHNVITVAGPSQTVYHCGGMLPNGTGVWNYSYTTDTFFFRRLSTPFDLTSAGTTLQVSGVFGTNSMQGSIAADGTRLVGMTQGVTNTLQFQRSVTFAGIQ